jgi:hypothetical protein
MLPAWNVFVQKMLADVKLGLGQSDREYMRQCIQVGMSLEMKLVVMAGRSICA